ncbi:MAG: CDP-alcohol phosphatidyltransferase family protein [Myxococcota bacterium]
MTENPTARPKPLITANQVTLARMALLPIPCAMVLYAPREWELLALIIYTLLGITDYVDGRMARHYGPTVLGALLDPVADKVFMAAVITPLAAFNLVSAPVMVAILLREFLITSLRSAMSLRGKNVKTSVLAKLKTSIQMVGAGFIFLIDRVPDTTQILTTLGVGSVGAIAVMIWRYAVTRKVSPLVFVPCSLIVLAFLVRLMLPPREAIAVHWGVILVFTWASALDYLGGAWAVLKEGRGHRIQDIGRLLWTLIAGAGLPLMLMAFIEAAPVWIVVMAAELTSGAVDNLRCHEGVLPKPWTYPLRSLALAVGSTVVLSLPHGEHFLSPAMYGAMGLALVMTAWTALDFWVARAIIWGEDAPAAPTAQSSVGR